MNQHLVEIDRSVFQKTPEERQKIKELKKEIKSQPKTLKNEHNSNSQKKGS
jgi:hypothetical protein